MEMNPEIRVLLLDESFNEMIPLKMDGGGEKKTERCCCDKVKIGVVTPSFFFLLVLSSLAFLISLFLSQCAPSMDY